MPKYIEPVREADLFFACNFANWKNSGEKPRTTKTRTQKIFLIAERLIEVDGRAAVSPASFIARHFNATMTDTLREERRLKVGRPHELWIVVGYGFAERHRNRLVYKGFLCSRAKPKKTNLHWNASRDKWRDSNYVYERGIKKSRDFSKKTTIILFIVVVVRRYITFTWHFLFCGLLYVSWNYRFYLPTLRDSFFNIDDPCEIKTHVSSSSFVPIFGIIWRHVFHWLKN